MDGGRGKMKFQNLSVKRLFGRVAIGLVLSMSGITIALFLVTKQTAVLLTGGALLLCALVGIFVLTQAFGKRLSQFTADLCQTCLLYTSYYTGLSEKISQLLGFYLGNPANE